MPCHILHAILNISYESIKQTNESAGKLLRLWPYFDSQDLWYWLLAKGKENSPEWFTALVKDKESFEEVMGILCDYSLVHCHSNSDGFSMHDSIYGWSSHVLNPRHDVDMARLALMCVGSSVTAQPTPVYWRRLFLHAQKCTLYDDISSPYSLHDNDHDHDERTMIASVNIADLLRIQDNFEGAERMYERALQEYEKKTRQEHKYPVNIFQNLSLVYINLGKVKQAEKMGERALRGIEKLGREGTPTLDLFNNLGTLYGDRGDFEKAREMFMKALQGYDRTIGRKDKAALTTLHNLGMLHYNHGKWREAEKLYVLALQENEEGPKTEYSSRPDTMMCLGVLFWKQGKLDDAERMLSQAFAEKRRLLGPNHPSTLQIIHSLGDICSNQYQKKGKAIEMYTLALEGYRQSIGLDDPEAQKAAQNLLRLRGGG